MRMPSMYINVGQVWTCALVTAGAVTLGISLKKEADRRGQGLFEYTGEIIGRMIGV